MIDTTDLDSYYPGYDEYCEPKEENVLEDPNIDEKIDEMILEKLKEKESEENGLH